MEKTKMRVFGYFSFTGHRCWVKSSQHFYLCICGRYHFIKS